MSNKPKTILGSGRELTINVGHNNFVLAERVIAIVETGPLPSRRLREEASSQNRLVDATAGRKMRSLIVTDSNHIIISSLTPARIQERMEHDSDASILSKAQMELSEGEFVS